MALSLTQGLNVIGTANGVSLGNIPGIAAIRAGSVGALLAHNPVGKELSRAGMRFAATGGNLVRGIFLWETPDGPAPYETFVFPMNPEAIRDQLNPKWAEIEVPGQNRPVYHFVNGGARELSFTLHFFYEERDRAKVRDAIEKLQSLTQRPATHTSTGALGKPPALYFYFGEYIRGARFIVKSLSVESKELFDPLTLLPLYSTVEITLAEAPNPAGSNPTLSGFRGGTLQTILRGARF